MKFIHLADAHLSDTFNFDRNISAKIRKASWMSFEKALRDNRDVDFALIAGDLFERSYFSSNDFSRLFKIIKNFGKDVYYVSGNHDYFDEFNSLFLKEAPDNFHIFGSKELEMFEKNRLRVYGISYEDRVFKKKVNLNINLDDEFFNIFLIHGDVDRPTSNYFNLSSRDENIDSFDYIAMGHIHKKAKYANIYYSGSLEPHDFSDVYDYGYLRYDDGKITFIDSSSLKFYDFKINFEDFENEEDLIEYVNRNLRIDKDNFVRIKVLTIKNIDKKLIKRSIDASYVEVSLVEDVNLDKLVSLFPNSLLSMYADKFLGKDDEESLLARRLGLEAILRSRDD